MPNQPPPSPLGLAVLCLLYGGPLHPYRMQRLLKEWGKDQVINVGQRSSLYKTIGRLNESGLIAVRQTERDHQYPERTVYEITNEGRRSLAALRDEALSRIVSRNDPFDLALALSRDLAEEELRHIAADRLAALRVQESALRHRAESADQYLNEAERMIILHLVERVVAEIRWHEELIARMPKIAADFAAGIGGVKNAPANLQPAAGDPATVPTGNVLPAAGDRALNDLEDQ